MMGKEEKWIRNWNEPDTNSQPRTAPHIRAYALTTRPPLLPHLIWKKGSQDCQGVLKLELGLSRSFEAKVRAIELKFDCQIFAPK